MITFHIYQNIVESQLMLCTCILFYGIVLAQNQTKRAVRKGALASWQAVPPPLWTRLLTEPHYGTPPQTATGHTATKRHTTRATPQSRHLHRRQSRLDCAHPVHLHDVVVQPSGTETLPPPAPWPLTPDSRSRTSTMQDAAFDGAALVPHC